jgi:hypothetical protein
MNLKHSFDRLLGDRDAMEDAGHGGSVPETNGSGAAPYPVVTTEEDGSIAFSLSAPGLVESSISVKQEGVGKYVATADKAESVSGHRKTNTHFTIRFVLPPEVAGEATPSYDGTTLRIMIAPR